MPASGLCWRSASLAGGLGVCPCDGERLLLPPAQDHKRIGEGDTGPDTGAGAYAPAPLLDEAGLQQVRKIVLEPVVQALCQRGIDYGVIYRG